ncbi:hypothetical protein ACFFRR_007424 [Megaselia abdita]
MFLFLAILVFLVLFWIFVCNGKEDLPGPIVYLPLFGNALQLGLNSVDYLTTILKWQKEFHRKIFRVWIAGQHYSVFTKPEDIEVILSSTEILLKKDVYDFLRPWLGDGLLTSYSSKWHKHRKIITPSFHFQILKEFLTTMNKTSQKFVDKLKEPAIKNQLIDIQELVHKCTLDIISETAFGSEINSLDNENEDIVTAINDLCYIVSERMFSAVKRFDMLFVLFPSYWRQKRQIQILKDYMKKIIDERRMIVSQKANVVNLQQNNNPTEESFYRKRKMAFLDNLLTAEIDNRHLTFQEIFEEVSTFLFEGHDTTASAITFMFFCLSRNPSVQEKLYEEQMRLSSNEGWDPTYEDVLEMKYMDLVIKETLRLFPSVPIIARTLQHPTVVNGSKLPTNSTIILVLMGMGYNENNFLNPCEFSPERFSSEKRTGSNPYDVVPFSAGPRNCIGQKFATMEIKTVMANIVRNYIILPPEDGISSSGIFDVSLGKSDNRSKWDPLLGAALTLKSCNGVWLRLKER